MLEESREMRRIRILVDNLLKSVSVAAGRTNNSIVLLLPLPGGTTGLSVYIQGEWNIRIES